ncbi:MAG: PilN domain-containing protein [Candidatus Acidiferrales bacterium]
MRIRLNLATKPLVTHRKFLAGSGLLGVVAAVLFLGLGWHVYLARKANAEMRAKSEGILRQVLELEQQRTSLEQFFGLEENAKLHDRAAFINGLIDARSFNWTLMFMDLEKVLPAGVHVVSIMPTQDKGRVEVKFTVGATSDDAKLKFLKALEESKTFTHVQLIDVRVPSQRTGEDQVVVELTAEYSRT